MTNLPDPDEPNYGADTVGHTTGDSVVDPQAAQPPEPITKDNVGKYIQYLIKTGQTKYNGTTLEIISDRRDEIKDAILEINQVLKNKVFIKNFTLHIMKGALPLISDDLRIELRSYRSKTSISVDAVSGNADGHVKPMVSDAQQQIIIDAISGISPKKAVIDGAFLKVDFPNEVASADLKRALERTGVGFYKRGQHISINIDSLGSKIPVLQPIIHEIKNQKGIG